MTMSNRWVAGVFVLTVGLVGCQGSGQMYNFTPHALSGSPVPSEGFQDDSLKILVQPFQDKRMNQERIGSRTHLGGGATHFNVWNGKVGEGMADLAVEYLQQRKWQAVRAPSEGDATTKIPGDVILTGEVLNLEANGKSGPGFTNIEVKMKVGFEAKNTIDGSTVRMVLGANGSDSVLIFDPTDIEELTNLVAKDLFTQLFRDLTVKDKKFSLK